MIPIPHNAPSGNLRIAAFVLPHYFSLPYAQQLIIQHREQERQREAQREPS